MLVTPQPNRLLMSESQLPQSEGLTPRDTGVKQKKTLRRLSDILKGQTEQVDLWVV